MTADKIFGILLVILIPFSAGEAEKYSGGTGEPNEPYRIATGENRPIIWTGGELVDGYSERG